MLFYAKAERHQLDWMALNKTTLQSHLPIFYANCDDAF